jgi:citrate lyase subunit beta/citryl-CoA lyase
MTRPLRAPRSCLTVPGSSLKMLEKATSLGADQAILDLEDSVAPTDKVEARAHVVAAVMDDRGGDRMVSVRVNPVGSTDGILDLEAVAGSGRLETVVIPRSKHPKTS